MGGTTACGWASPASNRTTLLYEALALVTVEGAIRSPRAFGDAAELVLLRQGKVEILITPGSGAATDGWEDGVGRVETDSDLVHSTQGPGYNDSENGCWDYISKSGVPWGRPWD